MPYLLRDLADGKSPSWAAVPPDTTAGANEKLVDDIPPGAVWDAANQRLRSATDADKLDAAKAAKKRELEAAYGTETSESFGGGPNAVFVAIGTGFTTPQDARVAAFRTRTQKLSQKLSQVDAAATTAQVAAVAW